MPPRYAHAKVEPKDYLGTLALISTLLLAELDTEGAEYKWSDPPWMASVTYILAQAGWFFLLTCIIGCISTTYASFVYDVRVFTTSPTLFFLAGMACYVIELCIDYYVEAMGLGVPRPMDDASKRNFFLLRSIPVWLWIVGAPIYVFYIIRGERREASERAEVQWLMSDSSKMRAGGQRGDQQRTTPLLMLPQT